MKQILVGVLLLIVFNNPAFSQTFNQTDASGISLSMNITENSLIGGQQSRSELTISNNGIKPLPASGWEIYFNAGYFEAADTMLARIVLVNGDLLSLTPGSKFGALQPGEQKKLVVNGGSFRNVTEYPLGFYLSFNNELGKGYPLKLLIQNSISTEKHDLVIANRIYKQNQLINNIPADKLTKIFPSPTLYTETNENFVLDTTVFIRAETLF